MLGTALHHPAFEAPDGWPFSHDDCEGVRASIIRQHAPIYSVSPAYTDFTCQHGGVLAGRTTARLSGANGGTWQNLNWWAICMIVPMGHQPTDACKVATLDLADSYPGPGYGRVGHQQLTATGCPNPIIQAWIDAGCPRPGVAPPPVPPGLAELIATMEDDTLMKPIKFGDHWLTFHVDGKGQLIQNSYAFGTGTVPVANKVLLTGCDPLAPAGAVVEQTWLGPRLIVATVDTGGLGRAIYFLNGAWYTATDQRLEV